MDALKDLLTSLGLMDSDEYELTFDKVKSDAFFHKDREQAIQKANMYLLEPENEFLGLEFEPFEYHESAGREQMYGTNDYVICLKVSKGVYTKHNRTVQGYMASVWIARKA